jgi:rod shape determining protein RodA
MFNRIFLYLKKFDWVLFSAVILLISFGLAEIYSIALSNEDLSLLNFKKQVFFIVIGILLLFVASFIDYQFLRSYNNALYILGVLLLAGVLVFGKTVRGTTGWFEFAGLSLQPVEFAKFILIVFLARYFSSFSVKSNPLKHLFVSGLASMIFIALVMKQPDFGSAVLLFYIWGIMLVSAGFQKKYLIIMALVLMVAFASGWFFFFEDYQKDRIMTYIHPTENSSLKEGYNINQAIIAVGSGGIMGRGIGFGSQSQLKFLPEAQNDFIFAVVAEELGFFGVFLMIGFFAVIFFRLLSGARKASNDFGIYYLVGVTALIFIEMFINIGMNIGLLPVVGISLPFLSYGGSAIVASLLMIGVAESVIIRSKL